MAMDTLSSNDITKLKDFMDQGTRVLQEVEDLNAGLKDTAKHLAEELNIKPAFLMKALRIAYKANMDEEKEKVDIVEELLQASDRL